MNDKQPEALRLADELEMNCHVGTQKCAARELRRLHAENAELKDKVEWNDKGLAEWRVIALSKGKEATAARATARIAITHLQKVLDIRSSYDDLKAAETAARDWLESIGAES